MRVAQIAPPHSTKNLTVIFCHAQPHSYFLSSSHKVLVRGLYGKVTARNSESIVKDQNSPVTPWKGDINQLSCTYGVHLCSGYGNRFSILIEKLLLKYFAEGKIKWILVWLWYRQFLPLSSKLSLCPVPAWGQIWQPGLQSAWGARFCVDTGSLVAGPSSLQCYLSECKSK